MKRIPYRRVARNLARCAAHLLPSEHAKWGEAMRREVEHIEDDREALRWAAGTIWAAAVERISALLSTRSAGYLLALFVFLQALNMFFAPALIIAYRMRWFTVDAILGGQLPGDHYHRFIPLMNEIPASQVVLGITAGLLLLVSAWRLPRRRGNAFIFLFAGLLVAYAGACAGWADQQIHPALAEIYRQTFTFPKPNFRRDYFIPIAQQVFPALAAAVVWWREHRLHGSFS